MSKKSELHRWALLDKAGKNRGTCEAEGPAHARRTFTVRRGRPIPKDWTVADRGPVQAQPIKVFMDPPEKAKKVADALTAAGHPAVAPAPRPFQVGDRVRGFIGSNPGNPVMEGIVTKVEGRVVDFRVEGDPPHQGRWAYRENLFLLEPAPQPKAEEEGEWKIEAENYKAKLRHEERAHQSTARAKDAEIASLKAEVERLTRARDGWEDDAHTYAHNAKTWEARTTAAKAKLDDIKAILRTGALGFVPDFQAMVAIKRVVDRTA